MMNLRTEHLIDFCHHSLKDVMFKFRNFIACTHLYLRNVGMSQKEIGIVEIHLDGVEIGP